MEQSIDYLSINQSINQSISRHKKQTNKCASCCDAAQAGAHTAQKHNTTLRRDKEASSTVINQRKSGESANAVPHYHKLCSRVSRIWGNRRGQHTRSAMDEPHPGRTTLVIMVSPLPGKYELCSHCPAGAPRMQPGSIGEMGVKGGA